MMLHIIRLLVPVMTVFAQEKNNNKEGDEHFRLTCNSFSFILTNICARTHDNLTKAKLAVERK